MLRIRLLVSLSLSVAVLLHNPPGTYAAPVINEFLYTWENSTLEFIEIFNNGEAILDLSKISIADSRNKPVIVGSASVEVGGYAVLTNDKPMLLATFGIMQAFEVEKWPVLNNSEDTIYLLYEGMVIDSVKYRHRSADTVVSVERRSPFLPSSRLSTWGRCIDLSRGTPGRQNSIFVIDNAPPQIRFAEEIDQNKIEVQFSEPVEWNGISTRSFNLDGITPSSILVTSDSSVIATWVNQNFSGDLTINSIKDLFGNNIIASQTEVALIPEPGELVINEIMYEPLPNQPEYVELLSKADHLLTLRALNWTGGVVGKNDTLYFGRSGMLMAAMGFAVVFSSSSDQESLESDDYSRLVPIYRSSLSLRNDEDVIRLNSPMGVIIDEVAYTNGWHNPAFAITKGISLERVDPERPSNERLNWGSCAIPAGGTPGAPNSLYSGASEKSLNQTLSVTPEVFSPDFDGFDDSTVISFESGELITFARIRIFDVSGRLVRLLIPSTIGGYGGNLNWDGLDDEGRETRVGIYIVHLEAINALTGASYNLTHPVVVARPL